jgi:phosphoglycerol transferase
VIILKKNIVKNIASMILIFLGACIIAGVNYINNNFDNINFAEIIFNLKDGAFTAGKSIVSTTIIRMVIDIILWIFIFLLPYIISHITHKHLEYIDKNNKGHPLFKNHLCLYSFIVFFISLIYAVIGFNIIDYIKSKNTYSNFINDNYVAPTRSNVTFNGTKHNLIYIYLESMESSYADKNSGGLKDSNLIPNLTNLAKDNINFSNTNNLGARPWPRPRERALPEPTG